MGRAFLGISFFDSPPPDLGKKESFQAKNYPSFPHAFDANEPPCVAIKEVDMVAVCHEGLFFDLARYCPMPTTA